MNTAPSGCRQCCATSEERPTTATTQCALSTQAMPRKFNTFFCSTAGDNAIAKIHDLAFLPTVQDGVRGVPAEDRPWMTASGPCIFYLTYHQLPLFDPVVNRYDACNSTDVGVGSALNPVQSTAIFASNSAPGLSNDFGKPVADNSPRSPHHGNLYVPMAACNLKNPADFANNVAITVEQVPLCPAGVHGQIEIAVSSDGGQTFNDYIVAPDTGSRELPVWAVTAAVDAAGNV